MLALHHHLHLLEAVGVVPAQVPSRRQTLPLGKRPLVLKKGRIRLLLQKKTKDPVTAVLQEVLEEMLAVQGAAGAIPEAAQALRLFTKAKRVHQLMEKVRVEGDKDWIMAVTEENRKALILSVLPLNNNEY